MGKNLDEEHPWHPSQVTRKKVESLDSAIRKEIKKRWKPDEDGDYPIQFHLVDRTRCGPTLFGFASVPYEHAAETQEELQDVLDALLSNTHAAVEDLMRFVKLRKLEARMSEDFEKEVMNVLGYGRFSISRKRALEVIKQFKDEHRERAKRKK